MKSKKWLLRFKRGQSFLQYTFLLVLIAAGLMGMSIYLKRAYQGRLRSTMDTISQQPYVPGKTISTVYIDINQTVWSGLTGIKSHTTEQTVNTTKYENEKLPDFRQERIFDK